MEFIAENLQDTIDFAQEFAKSLRQGDVVLLYGDLGAGKTTFVRQVCKALGVEDEVTSPTFTLLNEYYGTMPIYHFDMYRLGGKDEALEMGFDEYFDVDSLDGIVVVEWPEQVEGLITCPHINVEIKKIDDNSREIILGGGK